MSLILEALRKSESERQQARPPGLMTPALAPVRRWGGLWLLLVGLPLLLLVGAAGWWLGSDGGPPTAPASSAPAAAPSSAAETGIGRETPAPAANSPETGSIAKSGPTPAASLPAPDPAPPAAPPPAASRSDTAPPDIAVVAEPAPAAAPPAPAPPASDNRHAAAPVEQLEILPSLAAVPAARRERLPPLRLSMHVFDGEPAQRFVLIDGRRFGQGEPIESGIEVDEIRRDGVVLAIDGGRYLLQRP
jgi:general secretion pathway protein B